MVDRIARVGGRGGGGVGKEKGCWREHNLNVASDSLTTTQHGFFDRIYILYSVAALMKMD